jgi:ATP-dependent protease Clp ATPase subunit
MKAQNYIPNKEQINKMMQLKDTALNRTGIMILGDAGSGKTVVFNILYKVINILSK